LRIRAKRACTDSNGVERKDGEEWLVRKIGLFTPRIDEEVIDTVFAMTITDTRIIQFKAT
jgi:hypothetical protein